MRSELQFKRKGRGKSTVNVRFQLNEAVELCEHFAKHEVTMVERNLERHLADRIQDFERRRPEVIL